MWLFILCVCVCVCTFVFLVYAQKAVDAGNEGCSKSIDGVGQCRASLEILFPRPQERFPANTAIAL
jgi:hypothetical protein